MIDIFLLAPTLCLDTFIACTAYGTGGIKFSWKQILLLNGVCSSCLGVSLLFGTLIDYWVPESFTKGVCFFTLLFLGILKLTDSSIRGYLKAHKQMHKDIHFTLSSLHFIINIYGNPIEADRDYNKTLSWKETFFFSLAMSLDSLVIGTMAAFMKLSVPLTVLCTFLFGEAAAHIGLLIGRKIGEKFRLDLSFVAGIFLIILAFTKL